MKFKTAIVSAILIILSATTAHAISEEERRTVFRTADENKDRVLVKGEFKNFIRGMAKLGHKKAREAVLAGAAGIEVGFKRVDENKDGKITVAELRKFQ